MTQPRSIYMNEMKITNRALIMQAICRNPSLVSDVARIFQYSTGESLFPVIQSGIGEATIQELTRIAEAAAWLQNA